MYRPIGKLVTTLITTALAVHEHQCHIWFCVGLTATSMILATQFFEDWAEYYHDDKLHRDVEITDLVGTDIDLEDPEL